MKNDTENILLQKSIQEMVMVANEFCHFVETAETQSKEIVLNVLQKMMPLMYLKGSLLPEISVSNPDANVRFVTEEDWNNIYNVLKNKIENDDHFLFLKNDSESDDTPETFSISEEIADIYQDMKDCLKLLQINTKDAQENAISELYNLFMNHWGIRVCRVQYAIHQMKSCKE